MSSTDPSAADGPVDDQPRDAEPPAAPDGDAAAAPLVHADRSRTFPRDARLLNGRAYDAVFGDNRRVADRFWTVLAHRVPDGAVGDARLGLAVAKKRARRAVDRNRLKRVARESFRHARGALAGQHVVVMNRDAATSATTAELRVALDALWSRLSRPAGPDERRAGGRRTASRPSGKRSSSADRPAAGTSTNGPRRDRSADGRRVGDDAGEHPR